MPKKLKEYLNFKLAQHVRINGLNQKDRSVYEKALKENMKQWVKEAIATGC